MIFIWNFNPFPSYAITLFPFIFIGSRNFPNDTWQQDIIRHEKIHIYQQLEHLLISCFILLVLSFFIQITWWIFLLIFLISPFYWVYGIEYLVRLIIMRDTELAYETLSFECEAYKFSDDLNYLKNRKWFKSYEYLFTKNLDSIHEH
jgi:Trk-type K+ transport system membrane component